MAGRRRLLGRMSRIAGALFAGEPNSSWSSSRDEIHRILVRLETLSDDDVRTLADAWQREDATARQRAWTRAKVAIADAGREEELAELRESVASWMSARRSEFGGIEGLLGGMAETAAARHAAAPAILDAGAALLAMDALDPDDQAVLSRPWTTLSEG